MKKTFRMAGMVVAMLLMLGFVACSDDKEGEPADPETHDQELIGSWVCTYGSENDMYVEEERVKFRRDGVFEAEDRYEEDGDSYKSSYSGTWSTNKGRVTFVVEKCKDYDEDEMKPGDKWTWSYRLSDGRLYMDGTWFDPE